MIIEIFGIGCNSCRRMELEVLEIVQKMHLQAQVTRVDDLEKILLAGLTVLPGLLINGELVASGYSGYRNLERILQEAASNTTRMEKND